MKYGVVPSRSDENCWHVGDMETFETVARFYGADAEKDTA
jgi:hypothetical protein